MKTSKPAGLKLSNLSLLAVIGILSIGILLDGTLYNKAPETSAIYPLADIESVEAHNDDQLILAIKKTHGNWLQTYPASAPVQSLRVQPLLDTNKYNQRSYALNELPQAEIFSDPITLKLNEAVFQFGTIEPVSNLRYVRSGERVYLQPDTVLPMLSAADNVFVDLKITGNVDRVTIGTTIFEQPDVWSDLKAIDIIGKKPADPADTSIKIQLLENDESRLLTATHTEAGYTITSENNFIYLLSTTTAQSLGLTEFLPQEPN